MRARKYLETHKNQPFEISDAQTRSQTSPNSSLNINQMTQHPKSGKRAIWDTFAPSKTPQIFEIATLGYNLRQKCTPNQENEQFGIHSPSQKHPKSRKRSILGYIHPFKNTPNLKISLYGIFALITHPQTREAASFGVHFNRLIPLFQSSFTHTQPSPPK